MDVFKIQPLFDVFKSLQLLVQSLHFHLQASPEEWTNALGVVVTDWLAHVILKAAVTLEVWLLDVWTRARAQAAYRTALGKTDGLICIYLDKLVDDALVSLYAGVAELLAEITLTVTLQQYLGKHA